MVVVDRKEDMSPDGYMRLIVEDDGDIIITVASGNNDGGVCCFADVQFCTYGGGGGSPKTLKALRNLMVAMAEDNINHLGRRNEFLGEELLKNE